MAAKSASAKPTEAKKTEAAAAPAKAKAATGKPAAAKSEGAVKGNALQRPITPSKELIAVIGEGTHTRADVVSKVWAHIKAHNLQNPENKREIIADAKLHKVFGKDRATMFEMSKLLSQHMK